MDELPMSKFSPTVTAYQGAEANNKSLLCFQYEWAQMELWIMLVTPWRPWVFHGNTGGSSSAIFLPDVSMRRATHASEIPPRPGFVSQFSVWWFIYFSSCVGEDSITSGCFKNPSPYPIVLGSGDHVGHHVIEFSSFKNWVIMPYLFCAMPPNKWRRWMPWQKLSNRDCIGLSKDSIIWGEWRRSCTARSVVNKKKNWNFLATRLR